MDPGRDSLRQAPGWRGADRAPAHHGRRRCPAALGGNLRNNFNHLGRNMRWSVVGTPPARSDWREGVDKHPPSRPQTMLTVLTQTPAFVSSNRIRYLHWRRSAARPAANSWSPLWRAPIARCIAPAMTASAGKRARIASAARRGRFGTVTGGPPGDLARRPPPDQDLVIKTRSPEEGALPHNRALTGGRKSCE